MKPQENVAPNNGANLMFDASVVNTSSVNSTGSVQQTQARFLFREDSDNAVEAPLDPGDAFVETTPDLSALGGLFISDEGLFATSAFDIEVLSAAGIGLTPAQQFILNAIGIWAGLGSVGGAATNGFANFGSLTDNVFTPLFVMAVNVTGDFRATGGVDFYPGIQPGLRRGVRAVVPEPTSLALLALGSLVGRMYAGGRRQRRRK